MLFSTPLLQTAFKLLFSFYQEWSQAISGCCGLERDPVLYTFCRLRSKTSSVSRFNDNCLTAYAHTFHVICSTVWGLSFQMIGNVKNLILSQEIVHHERSMSCKGAGSRYAKCIIKQGEAGSAGEGCEVSSCGNMLSSCSQRRHTVITHCTDTCLVSCVCHVMCACVKSYVKSIMRCLLAFSSFLHHLYSRHMLNLSSLTVVYMHL